MNALAKWLDDNGINQTEFASLADVAVSNVSLWVSGQRVPELPGAVAIERVTGIPVSYWVGRRPVRPGCSADDANSPDPR